MPIFSNRPTTTVKWHQPIYFRELPCRYCLLFHLCRRRCPNPLCICIDAFIIITPTSLGEGVLTSFSMPSGSVPNPSNLLVNDILFSQIISWVIYHLILFSLPVFYFQIHSIFHCGLGITALFFGCFMEEMSKNIVSLTASLLT
jgi:hypothetical protein